MDMTIRFDAGGDVVPAGVELGRYSGTTESKVEPRGGFGWAVVGSW